MILSDGSYELKLGTLKSSEQRILSLVFERCASDRVLSESEEGELGVTHLFFDALPV